MTKNYLKPEMEVISVYSEGVLAASVLQEIGTATGEGITLGAEFNPWTK